MKKLFAALVLCVSTAAFAGDTKPQVKDDDKGLDATDLSRQKPGDSIREAQRDAEEGIDASEVGPRIGKAVKGVTGIQTEDEGTFKRAQAFEMRGTLKDTTLDGVTIERAGLPAADLDVRDKTVVMLDGKKVKADALPEGAQVRVRFQLEGQEVVAVELRATSPKAKAPASRPDAKPTMNEGTGGSGPLQDNVKDDTRSMKNEVKDEAHDLKKDANQTKNDVNQELNQ